MFDGLCAFPLTPLSEDGVDQTALARLVGRITDAGVKSIGVLGSTGVYPYLSRDERREALQVAVGSAGDASVMSGIGALRTREVIANAEDAQLAGASALLLTPVSYHRLTANEVFGLYRDVVSASSLPVFVYDSPGTTGFVFSDELLERIARLPRIGGIKIPPPPAGATASRLAELRGIFSPEHSIGLSGDWEAADALLAGYDVWHSVIAGIFPRHAMELADAALAGNAGTAREISRKFDPIWALFKSHGSLRVVAAIAEELGLTGPHSLPSPLKGLEDQTRSEIRDSLKLTGLDG